MSGALSKCVWAAKLVVRRFPGTYRAFVWYTTKVGHGKVYRVRLGPLKGFRWQRDNSTSFWYHLGLYEPHVAQLIASRLSPGKCFWDIGANAGYHSLVAARVVGPEGRVLAVEPHPSIARTLRAQVSLNGLSNVFVHEAAVSGSPGQATLMARANTLMSALATVTDEGEAVPVASVSLDSLLEYGAPDVVKIDIEGGETAALRGAHEMLKRHPVMLLSVHGDTEPECRAILQGHGYAVTPLTGFGQMILAK